METLRKYGKEPFRIAVIHGGPGAGGEMAPVARELSSRWGVLEPIQTKDSVTGQIEELKSVLEKNSNPPIILIGFSWGAWLSFLISVQYPSIVKKLILVGSGPFEEKYTEKVQKNRLARLTEEETTEYDFLIKVLNDSEGEVKNSALARLGELTSKTDEYDPILYESKDEFDFQGDIFQKVWSEASELRRSGKLLEIGKWIRCPVVAIHGDYDPHPAEGVQEPLSAILENFRFILLKNCDTSLGLSDMRSPNFSGFLNWKFSVNKLEKHYLEKILRKIRQLPQMKRISQFL